MDEFKNALEGKVSTEGWDAEKLVGYHKFLKESIDKEKSEVSGLREAKRAESERVERLKQEAATIEDKNKSVVAKPTENLQMTQFRSEQVEKAKSRLFSEMKLSEEEKVQVLDKFQKLDTGKLDADFIYTDLVSAVAASNPNKFLELTKSQERAEMEAQAEIERQAGSDASKPADFDKSKYSDATLSYAKATGITPDAAERQLRRGMKRVIG